MVKWKYIFNVCGIGTGNLDILNYFFFGEQKRTIKRYRGKRTFVSRVKKYYFKTNKFKHKRKKIFWYGDKLKIYLYDFLDHIYFSVV